MSRTISLSRYVHQSLSAYRWLTSVIVSILMAALFAAITLSHQVSSDGQMIRAISPYLATLVESQDRPELLRVLDSITESKDVEVVLLQNDLVLASSRDISEMDRPFNRPNVWIHLFGGEFTRDRILSRVQIARQGGPSYNAEIYLFTPLWGTLRKALGIALATFLVAIGISIFSSLQMRSAIRAAIRPLEQLHEEIRGLGSNDDKRSSPIPIRELEEIRNTISRTKVDLESALGHLAEERAQKLSAESYMRLIHDLHNPVAALRQMVRLINSPDADEEAKAEAAESVPRIADQILKQVTAAKKNLENRPNTLMDTDIRTCVQSGFQQVQAALGQKYKKHASINVPNQPVVVSHDPILLERAIVNLLENGLEASNERVQLTLENSGGKTSITVSDDGPGMDESKLAIYMQGRGDSGKAGRQAFGLSSANHIVRAHGGRLIYKKGNLGGASFEIRLGAV